MKRFKIGTTEVKDTDKIEFLMVIQSELNVSFRFQVFNVQCDSTAHERLGTLSVASVYTSVYVVFCVGTHVQIFYTSV